jgi:hypothetical protein
MAREIQLTQGKVAMVDDEDYERIARHKWQAARDVGGTYYAVRSDVDCRSIKMHREVMGLLPGDKRQVDHVHHNTLDNRKSELRICTPIENSHNTKRYKSSWVDCTNTR